MQVGGSLERENPLRGGDMLPWEESVSRLVMARYDDEDDLDDFEEDEELDEDEDEDEDEEYDDYDDYEDDYDDDGDSRHGRRKDDWN